MGRGLKSHLTLPNPWGYLSITVFTCLFFTFSSMKFHTIELCLMYDRNMFHRKYPVLSILSPTYFLECHSTSDDLLY